MNLINSTGLPDGYIMRPLEVEDYDKGTIKQHEFNSTNSSFVGYLECLSQLTVVGEISREAFVKRFKDLQLQNDSYHPHVICNETGRIVAAGTLLIEKKFIRQCGSCGHIEDIVVDSAQRGKNLGKVLLQALRTMAIERFGCYKVILDCEEGKVQFYEKCGFKEKGRQMTHYRE